MIHSKRVAEDICKDYKTSGRHTGTYAKFIIRVRFKAHSSQGGLICLSSKGSQLVLILVKHVHDTSQSTSKL